ncbi:MAG: aminotransferase class III-fold pyridoxal phosphate-dependent enzyme [Flavobacteriales bacterium]|nr:aminotransferase class III-fold pyridoxal phosphate-dependent enzyme [Flavobacteriales bacterium]
MAQSPRLDNPYPTLQKSLEMLAKARQYMTPISQTLAKGPGQYSEGTSPVYLERGSGCRVWDVDGNEYIDLNAAIGPLSIGYNIPAINEAIVAQLERGINFSLPHRLEAEVGALIHEIIPNAEAVRISKTGADVCSAAVRLARAYTGRKKVLCCGYHGWHDWYISVTSRAAGIPEEVRQLTGTFEYNDLNSLEQALDDDVACVIMEPFVFDPPAEGFLQGVQELCRRNGSVFILDEMWSGFRIALGGAQEFFGIQPDLAVYSKAVANGMPIAFLTGRRDILKRCEEDVFFFTTFGGEALSLAATVATIHFLREHNVPAVLAAKGKLLQDGLNALLKELHAEEYFLCKGYPCRTTLHIFPKAGDPLLLKTFIQQEMIRMGVLWQGNHNIMYAHSEEDLLYVLQAYRVALSKAMEAIKDGTLQAKLRGRVLEPVFRKVDHFNMKPMPSNTVKRDKESPN